MTTNVDLGETLHLFTTDERIRSDVSGKCGKYKQARMKIVQEKSFAMYPLGQAETELTDCLAEVYPSH